MSCSKSIVNIDISESSQLLSEIFDLVLGGLELLSILDTFTLLGGVESKVVEQDDLSVLCVLADLGDLVTLAVWHEGDIFTKFLIEDFYDLLKTKFVLLSAIWASHV